MAENEDDYLRQCLEQDICPACQQPLKERFGSGQSKDGVFCSLDCSTKWHGGAYLRRHLERMKKGMPDE